MVGVWLPEPLTIWVVRSAAHRIDWFVPGVGGCELSSPVALQQSRALGAARHARPHLDAGHVGAHIADHAAAGVAPEYAPNSTSPVAASRIADP